MPFSPLEFIYLTAWAAIGSILGFLSFGYTPDRTFQQNWCKGILPLFVGVFIAIPLCVYLEEKQCFSKALNILLSGLGAFGLPDFLLGWWPKLLRAIASVLVDRAAKNSIRYIEDDEEGHRDRIHRHREE